MSSYDNIQPAIDSVSAATLWDEVAAILSGLVAGGRYGLKIRTPHALVMTFLFGRHLSFEKKIKHVAKLAIEHASNLAAFACLYKVSLTNFSIHDQILPKSKPPHRHDEARANPIAIKAHLIFCYFVRYSDVMCILFLF